MALETILAIGIAVFALLYFSFNIDRAYFPLKILGLFFSFFLIIAMTGMINSDEGSCQLLQENITEVNYVNFQGLNATNTTVQYSRYCVDPVQQTALNDTFYDLIVIFTVLLLAYFSIMIVLHYLNKGRKTWFARR